jgi:hypothetical protein
MPKTQHDKQVEAEERQQDRDLRSPEEQLALLDVRPGTSKRERLKLAAEIAVRRDDAAS